MMISIIPHESKLVRETFSENRDVKNAIETKWYSCKVDKFFMTGYAFQKLAAEAKEKTKTKQLTYIEFIPQHYIFHYNPKVSSTILKFGREMWNARQIGSLHRKI